MAESFIAYIDESGDEGFRFLPDGKGSSRWFVLSAVVVRARNDHLIRSGVAQVRQVLGRPINYALHFRNLKHDQRVPYVDALSKMHIRTISVLVHKPCLKEPETFQDYRLYHYCVRFLLERVSWLCRDEHQKAHGDGSAKIVFSNRSAMSYADLREYVGKLIGSGNPLDVRIEPSVIRPEQIIAKQHDQYAGLQAADAVASSFLYAAQENRFGHTEPRYVQHLIPTIYRKSFEPMGYGIKFWPKESDELINTVPSLSWVKGFFQKK